MTNSAGSAFYVTYDLFRISDEWSNYKLTSVGQYDGTAGTIANEIYAKISRKLLYECYFRLFLFKQQNDLRILFHFFL